jgi:threonine dehydratase
MGIADKASVTVAAVLAAQKTVAPHIWHTPLVRSLALDALTGVVEGSGAIAIAPLLTGQIDAAGRRIAAVLTGRNWDAVLLQQILREYGEP